MEKTRFRVAHRKRNVLPARAEVTTRSRMPGHGVQHPGGRWRRAQEVGEQEVGWTSCIPGLEKVGEAAADSLRSRDAPFGAQPCLALPGLRQGRAAMRHSQCQEQHEPPMENTLYNCFCHTSGRSYLPLSFASLGFSSFPLFARHSVHLREWRT